MKDLKLFTDSGSINVTLRTDLINSDTQNFTIFQITGLDPTDVTLNFREQAILKDFGQIKPTSLGAIMEFAEVYGLNLVSYDPDGSNPVILVGDSSSDSFS